MDNLNPVIAEALKPFMPKEEETEDEQDNN